MTEQEINLISKNLRKMALNNTPTIQAAKAIADCFPIFDGNCMELEAFIFECDSFFNIFGTTTDNNLNHFAYSTIRTKLKGAVINFIMCRPDINTWPMIKQSLRENFGDRTDRQTLTREFLQLTKNRNETIIDFLNKVKRIKSRLEIKITSDKHLTNARKTLLIEQNETNAIDVLLANVDDNLRVKLDLTNPKSVNEASNTA